MSLSDRRLNAVDRRLAQRHSPVAAAAAPVNVIEFATSPRFLGRNLFPAQATVLKLITLGLELLTDYDRRLISEWTDGFALQPDGDQLVWRGTEGTPGDLLERIAWCRREGRRWFREIELLVGRRGSKGFLGAIFGAHVLFQLLQRAIPISDTALTRTSG